MNWTTFLNNFLTTHPGVGVLVVVGAIWSLIWKGLALWKSARLGSKVWFVILLIVNTFGILEILYIYIFSRKQNKPMSQSIPPTTPPSEPNPENPSPMQ